MINRLLIRIKVLQILYNYYLVDAMSGEQAVSLLKHALDHSYRLYLYLCGLPLHLREVALRRIEIEESKISPESSALAIYEDLSDNLLVRAMESDESFVEKLAKVTPPRENLKEYYEKVVTEVARTYPHLPAEEGASLCGVQLWMSLYRKYFLDNNDYTQLLESISVYLCDDVEIVFSFVTKVLNGLSDGLPLAKVLRPKYARQGEEDFGTNLLHQAIVHKEEYRAFLGNYFKNWDKDRVSEIDYLILHLAMTEAVHNPQIATSVTINEYLNLAKYYSSPQSTVFLNGILHRAFTDLKREGKILGD